MISFLIKYKKAILIITLAFFIGSIGYIGLDSYQRGSENSHIFTKTVHCPEKHCFAK